MMSVKNKKFKLFEAVLAAVCIVLVAEAAAPAAAIGNSQYFWWILIVIGFFMPYGLVTAELGTTYESEGGMFDWTNRAFGEKWGSRVAWLYWVNYPLWIGSLAVLFTGIIEQLTGNALPTMIYIPIQLVFIWLVVFVCSSPVSDNKLLLNISAVFKVIIMVSLGALGIYVAATKGFANDFSAETFLPSLDPAGLSFISVIIFNFMGFEVVSSFASQMENPKKQIPKAIIIGGVLITGFYLLASFGMGVAVPKEELSSSGGLIDSFILLLDGNAKWFVVLIGLMFMFTLAGNLISWASGVNFTAKYAADNNALPKIFGTVNKKGMPKGANILNGVIATVLVVAAPFIPSEDIFWSFFGLNVVALLLSYIMLFPTFLKLRKIDGDIERPFKVSGSNLKIKIIAIVPLILLAASVGFSVIPLENTPEEIGVKIPVLIGTIVTLIIGEIFAHTCTKRNHLKK
ncbi:APC family permease [Clostridium sardiniense]|uniref:APC family permease n=1 Tax=Clostridium sardiniense TaxID=29369 RepID=UPI003D327C84